MKTLGLIGRNISYSFSRAYFKEKFDKENIHWVQYINFDVQNLDSIKDTLNNENVLGCNVTIPYKQDIIPFLDALDVHAKQIGAVNTISKQNGKLIGSNTDWIGFRDSLLPLIQNRNGIKAIVLGTGGAAKAILYTLDMLSIEYVQVSRNPGVKQLSYEAINQEYMEHYQLIINCSPVGTFPAIDQCPNIPYEYLTSKHILYDLIYNPEKTLFLEKGILHGATICNGYQMLVNQAEAAWDIWKKGDEIL